MMNGKLTQRAEKRPGIRAVQAEESRDVVTRIPEGGMRAADGL